MKRSEGLGRCREMGILGSYRLGPRVCGAKRELKCIYRSLYDISGP